MIYVDDQGIWDVVFIHLRHDIVREQQPSSISNLAIVPLLRTKPMRRNTLCAQENDSKSVCPAYPGLQDINALAVLVAIDLDIT